jgi:hypothetical protein
MRLKTLPYIAKLIYQTEPSRATGNKIFPLSAGTGFPGTHQEPARIDQTGIKCVERGMHGVLAAALTFIIRRGKG